MAIDVVRLPIGAVLEAADVLFPDGETALEKFGFVGGTVTVESFGAVGDGVTDDTTAIQNALNAAAASSGSVTMSGKTYIVTTLSVPLNVRFAGVHRLRTKLKQKADTANYTPVILLASDGTAYTGFQQLENFTIDGNRSNQSLNAEGYGIKMVGTQQAALTDVRVVDVLGHGIVMEGDYNNNFCQLTAFTRVWVWNSGRRGIDANYLVVDTSMTDVEVGGSGWDGILLATATGTRMVNVASFWNTLLGFNFYQTKELQATNIRSERNGQHGFAIRSSQDCVLVNARAYRNSATDNSGTGSDNYSGFYVFGNDNDGSGHYGNIRLFISGIAGDGYANPAGFPLNGSQKYGVEEDNAGTYTDVKYDIVFGVNRTGNKLAKTGGTGGVFRW